MRQLGKRIRRAHSDAELQEFADGFCSVLQKRTRGVLKGNVPIAYLRSSQVTGIFDHQDRMVAGFVIGTSQPFRLFDFVPQDARETLAPPTGASWDDCCEATCFWRTPDVSPLYMSTRVWPRIFSEALGTGKRFMLGHNQSARLDSLYSRSLKAVTLYEGPSTHGLPSRLAAFETRGLWRRALRAITVETIRRLSRGLRSGGTARNFR